LRHNSVPADLPNHANDHNGAVGPDEADNAERPGDVEQRNLGAGHFSGDSQDSSSNTILSIPTEHALTIFMFFQRDILASAFVSLLRALELKLGRSLAEWILIMLPFQMILVNLS
jgi:hypothetical protein